MLVLSRRLDESITIGQEITVKVLEVQGDTVRIGIEAPRSVPIIRTELYEEVKEENRAVMHLKPESLNGLALELRKKSEEKNR